MAERDTGGGKRRRGIEARTFFEEPRTERSQARKRRLLREELLAIVVAVRSRGVGANIPGGRRQERWTTFTLLTKDKARDHKREWCAGGVVEAHVGAFVAVDEGAIRVAKVVVKERPRVGGEELENLSCGAEDGGLELEDEGLPRRETVAFNSRGLGVGAALELIDHLDHLAVLDELRAQRVDGEHLERRGLPTWTAPRAAKRADFMVCFG